MLFLLHYYSLVVEVEVTVTVLEAFVQQHTYCCTVVTVQTMCVRLRNSRQKQNGTTRQHSMHSTAENRDYMQEHSTPVLCCVESDPLVLEGGALRAERFAPPPRPVQCGAVR